MPYYYEDTTISELVYVSSNADAGYVEHLEISSATVTVEDGGGFYLEGRDTSYPSYDYYYLYQSVYIGSQAKLVAHFTNEANLIYSDCPYVAMTVYGSLDLENANIVLGTQDVDHEHAIYVYPDYPSRIYISSDASLSMTGGSLVVEKYFDDSSIENIESYGTISLNGVQVDALIDAYASTSLTNCRVYDDVYINNKASLVAVGNTFAGCVSISLGTGESFTDKVSGGNNAFSNNRMMAIYNYHGDFSEVWPFIGSSSASHPYIAFSVASNATVTMMAPPVSFEHISFLYTGGSSGSVLNISEGSQVRISSISSSSDKGTIRAEFDSNADAITALAGQSCSWNKTSGSILLENANINLLGATTSSMTLSSSAILDMKSGVLATQNGVTVNSGATLKLNSIQVEGSVVVNPGSNVSITKTVIKDLQISLLAGELNITGNDFSNTTITILDVDAGGKINLSGNSWGTTSREVVMARLGDFADYVYLGELEGEFAGTEVFTVTNTNDNGEGSLRHVLEMVAAYDGPNRTEIRFAEYLAGQTMQLEFDVVVDSRTSIVNFENNPVLLSGGTLNIAGEVRMDNMVLDSLIISEGVSVIGSNNILTGNGEVLVVDSPNVYIGLLDIEVQHPETAYITIACGINNSVLGFDSLGIPYRVAQNTEMMGATMVDAGEHLIIEPGVSVDWSAGNLTVSGKLSIVNETLTDALIASSQRNLVVNAGGELELVYSNIDLCGGKLQLDGTGAVVSQTGGTLKGSVYLNGANSVYTATNAVVTGNITSTYSSDESVINLNGTRVQGHVDMYYTNAVITQSQIDDYLTARYADVKVSNSIINGLITNSWNANIELTDCEINGGFAVNYYTDKITGSGNVMVSDKLATVESMDSLAYVPYILDVISEVKSANPYIEISNPAQLWDDVSMRGWDLLKTLEYRLDGWQDELDEYGYYYHSPEYSSMPFNWVQYGYSLSLDEGVSVKIGGGGGTVSMYNTYDFIYSSLQQMMGENGMVDTWGDGYYFSCTVSELHNGFYVDGTIKASFDNVQEAFVATENYVRIAVQGELALKNASIHFAGSNSDVVVASGGIATLEGGVFAASDGWQNHGETTMDSVEVRNDIISSGTLVLRDTIHSAAVHLEADSSATIVGTTGITTLVLSGKVSVSGITSNDFSNTVIDLSQYTGRQINLSGNYWGKEVDSLDDITSKIIGYSSSKVTISGWLETSPHNSNRLSGTLYESSYAAEIDGELQNYELVGNTTVAENNTVTLEEGVKWDLGYNHDLTIAGTLIAENEENADALVSNQRLSDIVIADAGLLQMRNANIRLDWGCVKVCVGGIMSMTGGSLSAVEDGVLIEQGGRVSLSGVNVQAVVDVAGTAVLTGNTFSSYIQMSNTADVSGSGNMFSSAEVFRLTKGYTGNTGDLLPLIGSVSATGAYISIVGNIADSTFSVLPETLLPGGYQFAGNVTILSATTVSLMDSVQWNLNGKKLYVSGELEVTNEIEADALVSSVDGATVYVNNGASLALVNANMNLPQGSLLLYSGAEMNMSGGSFFASSGGLQVNQGASVALSGVKVESEVQAYGSCVFENNTFDSCVYVGSASSVSGQGNTFTSVEVLRLCNNFTGDTAQLLSLIGSATAGNAFIGLSGTLATSQFASLPASLLPAGYVLSGAVTIKSGSVVTLADGVKWELNSQDISVSGTLIVDNKTCADALVSSKYYSYITVKSNGALKLSNANLVLPQGSLTINNKGVLNMKGGQLRATQGGLVIDSGATASLTGVAVFNEILANGTLTLVDSVHDAKSVTIGKGASAVVQGTSGISTLIVNVDSAPLTITGNDFSQTNVVLRDLAEGELIDLSGNYWGTTDLDEIVSKIDGYIADRVLISNVLSVPPAQGFSFDARMYGLHRVSDAATKLILSFNREIDASTVNAQSIQLLDANGQLVSVQSYEVQGKQVTLHIEPLAHGQYTVQANERLKDIDGNSYVANESSTENITYYSLAIDAPKIAMLRPNTTVTGHFTYVDIFFDQVLDAASISADVVHLFDANGDEIDIKALTQTGIKGNIFYRAYFDAATENGTYTVRIDDSVCNESGISMTEDYLHQIYVSSPDLAVADTIDVSDNLLGRYTTISYSVVNSGDGLAKGSWQDSIYLCKTAEWNEDEAILFGRVFQQNKELQIGESYSGSVTALLRDLTPGQYYVFVKSDMSSSLYEGNEQNNISAVGTAVQVHVQDITLGAQSATVSSLNEVIYCAYKATEDGTIALNLAQPVLSVKVFNDGNFTTSESIAFNDKSGLLNNVYFAVETGKTYYIQIQVNRVGTCEIELESVPFGLKKCSSNKLLLSNNSTTITIYGSRFDSETRVWLEDADGHRYEVKTQTVLSACEIQASFVLPENLYGIELTLKAQNASGETVSLEQKLITASAQYESLRMYFNKNLQGDKHIQRVGWVWEADLTVENKSDVDIENPIILVVHDSSDFAMYYNYDEAKIRDRSALLLTVGKDVATEQQMRAHEKEILQVYVKNYRSGTGATKAMVLSDYDTTVISEVQWSQFESALRPAEVDDAIWESWWGDMKPRIGVTVGDFVRFVRDMQSLDEVSGANIAELVYSVMQIHPDYAPSNKISGYFKDFNDKAISNALVELYVIDDGVERLVSSSFTDENGYYSLGGLKKGYHYVLRSSYFLVDAYGTSVSDVNITPIENEDIEMALTAPVIAPELVSQSGARLADDGTGSIYQTLIEGRELKLLCDMGAGDKKEYIIATGDDLSNCILYWAEPGNILAVGWLTGEGSEADVYLRLVKITDTGLELSQTFDFGNDAMGDFLADVYALEDGTLVAITETEQDTETTLTFHKINPDEACSWSSGSFELDNEVSTSGGWSGQKTMKLPFVGFSVTVGYSRSWNVSEDELSASASSSWYGEVKYQSDTVEVNGKLDVSHEYAVTYDCTRSAAVVVESGNKFSLSFSGSDDMGLIYLLNVVAPKLGTAAEKCLKRFESFCHVKIKAGYEFNIGLQSSSSAGEGNKITGSFGGGIYLGFEKEGDVFSAEGKIGGNFNFTIEYDKKLDITKGDLGFAGSLKVSYNTRFAEVSVTGNISASILEDFDWSFDFDWKYPTKKKEIETAGVIYQTSVDGITREMTSFSDVETSAFTSQQDVSAYLYLNQYGYMGVQYFDSHTGEATSDIYTLELDSALFGGSTNIEYLSAATTGQGLTYFAAQGFFLEDEDVNSALSAESDRSLSELIDDSRCLETAVVDMNGTAYLLDQRSFESFSWNGGTYDISKHASYAEMEYLDGELCLMWTSSATSSNQVYVATLDGHAWGESTVLYSSNWEVSNCYMGEVDDSFYVSFDVEHVMVDGNTTTTAMVYVLNDGTWYFDVALNSERAVSLYESYQAQNHVPEFVLNDPIITKLADGEVEFALSWEAEESYVYELTLDDEVISLVGKTSYMTRMKDGVHTYSLRAIAASGLTKESASYEISYDATAPIISNVMVFPTVDAQGNLVLNLKWNNPENVEVKVTIDDVVYLPGNVTEFSCAIAQGNHRYAIEVADASGNTRRYDGEIDCDLSNPVITMNAPAIYSIDTEKGISVVDFSWSGEAGVSYKFSIDGVTHDLGNATSIQLSLSDGHHAYELYAVGANGMSVILPGNVETDATAPELQLRVLSVIKSGEGQVAVTFGWSIDEYANLKLIADGKTTTVTGLNTYTLILDDGSNSARLKAVDSFGNESAAVVRFSSDASSPDLKLYDPFVSKQADGTARIRFSWNASDSNGMTHTLYVNGVRVYSGSAESYTMQMASDVKAWKVVSTDKYGNTTEKTDHSTYLMPVSLKLESATVSKAEGKDGRMVLSLQWSSSTSTTYEVWINGKKHGTTTSSSYVAEIESGNYSYKIVVADGNRNANTLSGSGKYDALAPVVTLRPVELKDANQSVQKVKISWSSNEKATYTLTLSNGKMYSGLSSNNVEVELASGKYTYTITATDENGNVSQVTSKEFSVDLTPAQAVLSDPVLTKESEGKTKVGLAWSCDADDATFKVELDGEEVYHGSALKATLSNVADGHHEYVLTVIADNGIETQLSGTFVTDATSPELVLNEIEWGKRREGESSVTFSWTSSEAATYKLLVDDKVIAGNITGNSYSCIIKDNTYDYSHTYQVIATDSFGNETHSDKISFIVDATAPEMSLISVTPSRYSEGISDALFTWTLDDTSATVYISIDGAEAIALEDYATSYRAFDLADGTHRYAIFAEDEYANASPTITGTFVCDATAPKETSLTTASVGTRRVRISWAFSEACSYTLLVDGKFVYFDNLSTGGSYETGTLSPGTYDYTIWAIDAYGNETKVSREFEVLSDAKDKYASESNHQIGDMLSDSSDSWLKSLVSGKNCFDGGGGGSGGSGAGAILPDEIIGSWDPNDIYGPAGYGIANWIAPQEMQFQVVCENKPEENIAHAAMVTITQQIDAAYDYSTFRLGDMMIAGNYITVEGDVQSYKGRVDWTSSLGVWVDVNAWFDADTGIVTWEFVAINPETGYVVSDPFTGLLAPNYNPPEGDGGVYYYVTPKSTVTTGTEIKAQASIVFDYNEPIETPTLTYTFDVDAPEAVVKSMAAESSSRYLYVAWEGRDVGSGVDYYNIFVSIDGGDWQLWQSGIAATSALYSVAEGEHTYAFFAQGIDYAGNAEALVEMIPAESMTSSIYVSQKSTLSVSAVEANRTGDELVLRVVFSEAASCSDWAAALRLTAASGAIDLSNGSFSYDTTTHTLTWTGSVAGVADGEKATLRLADGMVKDAQGVAMGDTTPSYSAPVVLDAVAGATYAAPTLVDYSGDGLLDMLVGENANGKGQVRIYLNEGTAEVADYASFIYAQTAADTPLTLDAEGCQGAIVRLADVTGDGVAEMLIGLADGSVRVFTAAEGGYWSDAGLLTCMAGGKSATIDVGTRAAIDFVDANGDGRVDMLVGTGDGNIVLYLDTAATGTAVFDGGQYLHDTAGRITLGNRVSVVATDVDGDGLWDLLVGSADGSIRYYRNEGRATEPLFGEAVSILSGDVALDLSESTDRVRIDAADINGDGLLDIAVGQSDGSVKVLYGTDGANLLGEVVVGNIPLPDAPQQVQISVEASKVTLSWDAVAEEGGSITYEVSYCMQGSTTPTVVSVSDITTTLELPDGIYAVQVRALNYGMGGTWSAAQTVTVDTVAPETPAAATAVGGETSATISWSSVADAASYELRYRSAGSSTWRIVTATETSQTLTDMAADGYEWQVRAVDAAGNASEWTSVSEFTVTGELPDYEKHWATGLVFDAQGSVTGGYYDVNKQGVNDSQLCWAAAATNVLTWWQEQGDTALSVSGVPTDAANIYATFCGAWENASGVDAYGFIWWLAGESTGSNYADYYDNHYTGDSSTGAYYEQYYTPQNVAQYAAQVSLKNTAADTLSTSWDGIYAGGGMITLGIFRSVSSNGTLSGGHSLTLWGYETEVESGMLTSIYVTDSDDGTTALITLGVEYDNASGLYLVAADAERLGGYYLGTYNYLKGFTHEDIVAPEVAMGSLTQTREEDGTTSVNFVWQGNADAVRYELVVDGELRYSGKDTVCALTNLGDGEHSYTIRAIDAAGNTGEYSGTLRTDAKADDAAYQAADIELGTLPGGGCGTGEAIRNWVGDVDEQDYFRISSEGVGSYSIGIDSADVDAALWLSVGTMNAAGQFVVEQELLINPDSAVHGLAGVNLGAGETRYIRVSVADGTQGTDYALTVKGHVADSSMLTDNNSLSKATQLSETDEEATLSSWVGAGDALDYYRLEMTESGSLSISLSELEQHAKVRLYQQHADGTVTQAFSTTAQAQSGLDRTLSLTSGVYYLEIAAYDNGAGQYNSTYALELEKEENGTTKRFTIANA